MLSHSSEVARFDLGSLKIILTAGSILSATIRMEAMERIPSLKYIREAYGLCECGLVTLTYPREKKNSVPGGIKAIGKKIMPAPPGDIFFKNVSYRFTRRSYYACWIAKYVHTSQDCQSVDG